MLLPHSPHLLCSPRLVLVPLLVVAKKTVLPHFSLDLSVWPEGVPGHPNQLWEGDAPCRWTMKVKVDNKSVRCVPYERRESKGFTKPQQLLGFSSR